MAIHSTTLRRWRVLPAACGFWLAITIETFAAEELMVTVELGKELLAEEMIALQEQKRVYIPLLEFASMILVPIEPNGQGDLTGTVTTTGVTFSLNVEARRLVVSGKTRDLGRDDVILFDQKIFVAEDILEEIIPVQLEFDFASMNLKLKPESPLPIQVRRKQEQLRGRILDEKAELVEPVEREIPYALFSPPTGDANIHSEWSKGGGFRQTYDTLFGAEVGYLTSQFFIRGDEQNHLTDARMRIGRERPAGGVFAIDGLTQAWAGDVRQPSLPLIGGGTISRGIMASSFPLDRPDTFESTTIDGDAQPGWDIELYQNGILIDFQRVGSDGRFAFRDVPLFYGVNLFRLVFYGPQGQLREETRRVNIGGDLIKPGKTMWSAFAGQPDQRVLEPLLASSGAGNETGFSFEAAHGISDSLSASGFVTRAQTSSAEDADMLISAGLGALISWDNFILNSNVAVQENGGYAIDLGAIAGFEDLSISARYAFFHDFLSMTASDGFEPLDALGVVRVQKSMTLPPLGPVLLGVRGEHRAYSEGTDEYLAGLDLRQNIGMFHISHALDLRLTSGDGEPGADLVYVPTVSLLAGDFWARGTARVNLESADPIESLAASVRYRLDDVSTAGAEIAWSPPSGDSNLNLSYSREFDFGFLSGNARLDSEGEFAVGASLAFSFGVEPGGQPFATSERLADSGSVAPFVYHDKNANGRFDQQSDEPLTNVGFRVDHGRRPKTRTSADGTLVLASLSTTRPLTVDIDEATLPDPFFTSALGPQKLQPRRGRVLELELPIVDSGEISGSVSAVAETETIPVGGILLRLFDQNGRRVADTRTLDDGFYLFERLPPGEYQIVIEAGQELEDIEIKSAKTAVTLPAGGKILDGIDIALELKGTLKLQPEQQDFDSQLFGRMGTGQEETE